MFLYIAEFSRALSIYLTVSQKLWKQLQSQMAASCPELIGLFFCCCFFGFLPCTVIQRTSCLAEYLLQWHEVKHLPVVMCVYIYIVSLCKCDSEVQFITCILCILWEQVLHAVFTGKQLPWPGRRCVCSGAVAREVLRPPGLCLLQPLASSSERKDIRWWIPERAGGRG